MANGRWTNQARLPARKALYAARLTADHSALVTDYLADVMATASRRLASRSLPSIAKGAPRGGHLYNPEDTTMSDKPSLSRDAVLARWGSRFADHNMPEGDVIVMNRQIRAVLGGERANKVEIVDATGKTVMRTNSERVEDQLSNLLGANYRNPSICRGYREGSSEGAQSFADLMRAAAEASKVKPAKAA